MEKMLEEYIGRLIGLATNQFRRVFFSTLKEHNISLSPEQFLILDILKTKERIKQIDLAKITSRDNASVTRILDNLEKKHLITRKSTAEDRRANLINITETGIELLKETTPILRDLNGTFIENLSENDLNEFYRIIKIMIENSKGCSYEKR